VMSIKKATIFIEFSILRASHDVHVRVG
jgi:hypothetical protein